jgi:serine/threonine protein kinase
VLAPGSSIAGYVVERVVDARGVGTVYKARQLRLDRPVALKLVDAEIARDPLVRERLRREARTVAALDHPNVVPLYEAGEDDGTVFIATRWVDGTDLGALIRRDHPLRPRRAARLAAQVAAALEVAHEQELIHRDIRPSNVIVTAEDHVYITDFGLTKRARTMSGFTAAGQMMGTIEYVAPEQIEGGESGPRGDVYGLACVLYEMLSGFPPFGRERGDTAKMWAHLNAPPPSVREQRPDVPEALDAVIRAGMSKRPDDRPSAAAFGAEVLRAVGEAR